MARREDYGEIAPALTQASEYFRSVDVGKAHIEKNYIRTEGLGCYFGVSAKVYDTDLVTFLAEQRLDSGGYAWIILDEEHAHLILHQFFVPLLFSSYEYMVFVRHRTN